jgi:hypothetical protein
MSVVKKARSRAATRAKSAPAATTESSPFLDTSEAAAFLRLKRRSLEAWRLTGSGPRFFRIGRRRYYKRDDLLAWAERQAATSTRDHNAA